MKKHSLLTVAILLFTLTVSAQTKSFKEIITENEGKVILVDIWASWCKPCMEEMPAMQKIHDKYKDKGVVFVYISMDNDTEAWKKASQKIGIADEKYNYLPAQLTDKEELKALNIRRIPRYFIYDKTGTLVNPDAPRPSEKALKKELDTYLE